jgi:hypothetical protein
LLVAVVTDEELATETDKDSVEVREVALVFWKLIKLYKVRAKILWCVEMDVIDNCGRYEDLIMELAQRYTVDHPDELMADADLHHVRVQALAVNE